MDLGLAFSYVFQDPDWLKKVIIHGLIGLIPIVGQLVLLGWALEISRRVIRHETDLLPDFEDFGGRLMLGLKGFVIGLIAALPIILVAIAYSIIAALAGDNDTMAVLFSGASICMSCFSILYGLLLMFAVPAAYGILAATDQLGEAISPAKIMQLLRAAPAGYLLTLLGTLIAGFIGGLGSIACGVGVILTYAYAFAIQGHLYGQAYNEATKAAV